MGFALHPDALAAGYGLVAHETIGSTSSDAMARLRDGEVAPFWVVSAHQTAGRGRRGSAWTTPPGNLAASLALRVDCDPATVATLGFVAGVAVAQALEEVTEAALRLPQSLGYGAGIRRWTERRRADSRCGCGQQAAADGDQGVGVTCDHVDDAGTDSLREAEIAGRVAAFRLKWPNDVLVDGAKLLGILLETEETRWGRTVVVGIGVNVRHAPQGLAYPTASLAAWGIEVSAETVFGRLSAAWTDAFAAWHGGRGFAVIRAAWLARAAGLGGPVAIRSGGAEIHGIFETIDAAGQLVARLPDGTRRAVSAGDVHFGNAASLRAETAA